MLIYLLISISPYIRAVVSYFFFFTSYSHCSFPPHTSISLHLQSYFPLCFFPSNFTSFSQHFLLISFFYVLIFFSHYILKYFRPYFTNAFCPLNTFLLIIFKSVRILQFRLLLTIYTLKTFKMFSNLTRIPLSESLFLFVFISAEYILS